MKDWSRIALGAVFGLAAPAWAMQASQVGLLDWHLPLIGPPQLDSPAEPPQHRFHHTSASLAPNASKKSLLLTYTVNNVLAALEPSTGDVVWRRRYPANHPNARHLSCSASSVIVLSGASGSDLSSLNGTTGAVEWSLAGEQGLQGQALCWNTGFANDLIWLTKDGVRRVEGRTGSVVWARSSGAEGSGNRRLVQLDGERLGLLDISPQHEQSTLSLQIMDARTGSLLGQTSGANHQVRIDNALVLTPNSADLPTSTLVWIDSGRLLSLKLGDKLGRPSRLDAYGRSPVAQVQDVGLAHLGLFVAHHEDGTAAAIACAEGRLELRWQFADATSDSLFAAFVDRLGDAHIGHLSFSSSLQLGSFQIYSAAATEAAPAGMLTGHTFPFDEEKFGSMVTFAFEATPPNAYNVATRSYISTTSGATQAWESSHLIWSQEQSLSTIDTPALYWDVAETVQHDSSSSLLADSSPSSRLRRHLSAVSRLLTRGPPSTFAAPVATGRQLVFVASSAYRTLFALDLAQQGRIVWRACISADAGRWAAPRRLKMFELESGRPRVSIALLDDDKSSSTPFVEFDALTGAAFDLGDAGPSRTRAVPSGKTDVSVPSSKVIFDVSGTSIAGRPGGIKTPTWTVHVAEREQVLAVAVSNDGVVASTGRILGDRSTLLKYLNPNLVAVAITSSATTSSSVLLVDTESGALLHKFGPIHDVDEQSHLSLALQDNWVVLTYRVAGEAARVSRVISIELYHASASLDGAEAAPIQAPSRTFVSTQDLEIKSFTRTKLGITSYNAIFVNSLGQVVAVPRRFLDPRRTLHKPTKQDQEELLLPYEAMLPADPRWVLSHQREVEGLRKVESFPGRLESESILFASGLDLFGSRVSPSRSFDVLSPTFNKVQLLITITVLSVGLAVTRNMVKARQVHQKWYSL